METYRPITEPLQKAGPYRVLILGYSLHGGLSQTKYKKHGQPIYYYYSKYPVDSKTISK